jgi:hypothetical protein
VLFYYEWLTHWKLLRIQANWFSFWSNSSFAFTLCKYRFVLGACAHCAARLFWLTTLTSIMAIYTRSRTGFRTLSFRAKGCQSGLRGLLLGKNRARFRFVESLVENSSGWPTPYTLKRATKTIFCAALVSRYHRFQIFFCILHAKSLCGDDKSLS